MADPQEITTIWKGETKRAARSARGFALAVLFLFAEVLTLGMGGCLNVSANKQFDELVTSQGGQPAAVREQIAGKKREVLKAVTRNSDATVAVFAELPLVLLFVFFATTFFLPLLIALMGFDQISAEVGPKSIRYLVVRAQRSSILLGKLFSQMTFLGALLLVCVLGMVGVSKWLNTDFSWLDCAMWTGRLWLAVMVIATSYASLTALCSAITRSGPLSLFLNVIALFTLWFVGLLSNFWALPGTPGVLGQQESFLAYIRYLVPSQFESQLLSNAPLELASGLFAHVGFALMFLGLAHVALKKRDL